MKKSWRKIIIYKSKKEYLNFLKSINSYKPFNSCFLPEGILLDNLKKIFNFISPSIIILHGSCVTGKRYSLSPEKKKDLDIVLINNKHVFWDIEDIFENIKKNKQNLNIDLDISITTHQGFINHLKNETSLGLSINQGFTIIPMR